MSVFFDTSVLVKLYYTEVDSLEFVSIVNKSSVIYLSEIAKIEFLSAVWKKVRVGNIDEATCKVIIECFENDFANYEWIPINASLLNTARNLLNIYGNNGLRTLDSLQLASALQIKNQLTACHTADSLLKELFVKEIF